MDQFEFEFEIEFGSTHNYRAGGGGPVRVRVRVRIDNTIIEPGGVDRFEFEFGFGSATKRLIRGVDQFEFEFGSTTTATRTNSNDNNHNRNRHDPQHRRRTGTDQASNKAIKYPRCAVSSLQPTLVLLGSGVLLGGALRPPPTPPRHEICTSSPKPAPATKSTF